LQFLPLLSAFFFKLASEGPAPGPQLNDRIIDLERAEGRPSVACYSILGLTIPISTQTAFHTPCGKPDRPLLIRCGKTVKNDLFKKMRPRIEYRRTSIDLRFPAFICRYFSFINLRLDLFVA
jgi:hypothetical protein